MWILGSGYFLTSLRSCDHFFIGGNRWCNLWLGSWISLNNFLQRSTHLVSNIGNSDICWASPYDAFSMIIFRALSWIDSINFFCPLFRPGCHTWHAYSTIGLITVVYICSSLSISTCACFKSLSMKSLWLALLVMFVTCVSQDRLFEIVYNHLFCFLSIYKHLVVMTPFTDVVSWILQ